MKAVFIRNKPIYNNLNILPYEYLLLPIIVCTVTTACAWLMYDILTIFRDFKALLMGNGLSVAVSVAMSLILIPNMGMQGTTFALMIGNISGIAVCIVALITNIRKRLAKS